MSFQSACFNNLLWEIADKVSTTLTKRFPEVGEKLNSQFIFELFAPARSIEFGDFALPLFQIVKLIKTFDTSVTPTSLELSLSDRRFRSSIAGGFLNFKLDSRFLENTILKVFSIGGKELPNSDYRQIEFSTSYGSEDLQKDQKNMQPKKKIVIDFSSPNIAKPFHVGHLRTTLIGESLTRTLRYLGHQVETLNYLGDWGTQFGFVYLGVRDNNPELLKRICTSEIEENEEEISVDDLVTYYVAATTEAKSQEKEEGNSLLLEARAFFKDLEAKKEYAYNFWSFCRKISVNYLNEIYQRLGINFDHDTGEAFFEQFLPETKEYLKPILTESKGALGFIDTSGAEDKFIRLYAEDGRSLYLARDVASARYRHGKMKADLLLYVVGSQQILNFQHLKLVLSQQSPEISDKVVHIPFGFVPGMKTREGGVISLRDLLAEASSLALTHDSDRTQDISEETAEKIGVAAIYFYFLKHSNIKDFTFKWEEALNFSKDSGPYLQYTLARLNRMITRAEELLRAQGLRSEDALSMTLRSDSFEGSSINQRESYLMEGETDPLKREILLHFDKFFNAVWQVQTTYEPCILAQYTIELAQLISRLYNSYRLIDESAVNVDNFRLYNACRNVLATSMYLLGLPLLESM